MRFLPLEPKIKIYEEGFENDDILGRRKNGQALSNFCENIETASVIALNGAYGTGKSHFLQKWVGAHSLENGGKALTVYLSAFNHDYQEDPLPAIILAIESRLKNKDEKQWKRVKDAAAKIAKPLAKAALRSGVAFVSMGVSELAMPAIQSLAEDAEHYTENYWKQEKYKQTAIESLRSRIAEFAQIRKLVIVIDELDRARPDYALSMLETIKHFFNVDNVHFILGVNMEALESKVKCRDGQEIDAKAYLQRFTTLSPLTLPDIVQQGRESRKAILPYIEHEATEMGLTPNTVTALCRHLSQVSKNYPISLRDAGKILSQTALVFSFLPKDFGFKIRIEVREIFLTLITTSILDKKLYDKFLSATVTQDEILRYYGLNTEDYTDFTQHVKGINWLSAGIAGEDYAMEYIVYMWITLTKQENLNDNEMSFLRRKLRSSTDAAEYIQKIHSDYIDIFSLNSRDK